MTLRELRYLVAVAELGHFGRAAAACGVSQPSLSTQVRKLEERLGVRVFERTSRRVALTPEGREVVAQARVVLDEVGRLEEIARRPRDPLAGSFRLGAIPTLGPYFLPHLLPRLRHAYPDLRLQVQEDLTAVLVERLRAGRLDAALLSVPVDGGRGLEAAELFHEPFLAALPAGHPLARGATVAEADVAREPLLLLQDGHCLRAQALALCRVRRDGGDGQGGGSHDGFEAASLETLRHMVAAGAGVTLLPALAAAAGAAYGALVELRPFAPPAPGRMVALVWRLSSPRRRALLALARFVRDDLPPGVEPVPEAGAGPRAVFPAGPPAATLGPTGGEGANR